MCIGLFLECSGSLFTCLCPLNAGTRGTQIRFVFGSPFGTCVGLFLECVMISFWNVMGLFDFLDMSSFTECRRITWMGLFWHMSHMNGSLSFFDACHIPHEWVSFDTCPTWMSLFWHMSHIHVSFDAYHVPHEWVFFDACVVPQLLAGGERQLQTVRAQLGVASHDPLYVTVFLCGVGSVSLCTCCAFGAYVCVGARACAWARVRVCLCAHTGAALPHAT